MRRSSTFFGETTIVEYPQDGSTGVPSQGLVIEWERDPDAVGYRVHLEQGDNDGLVIELPRGPCRLAVPDGFLRPDRETTLEIGVIGMAGNTTVTEVSFTTR